MKKQVRKQILELEQENTNLKCKLSALLEENAKCACAPYNPREHEEIIRKDILNKEAKLALLEDTMDISAKFIFDFNEKPLDMISFEEWFDKLTRKDLVGSLEKSERLFKIFDDMSLFEIKIFYREVLLMLYNKKKQMHIERCNKLIADSKAKDK